MSSTLGEKLRQAREERGISISEVAEQTRISSMYIKSIEDDNYKPLPGGIFNKGFVKSYAKYVGLDENEALQDYARLIAQNEETVVEDHQHRYRPEVLTDDARSASSLIPTIVFAGIILALMTGGILFVVNYIQNRPDSPLTDSNTTSNSANPAANVPETAPNPTPATAPNEIRIEFKTSETVSVRAIVDGTTSNDEITPAAPKMYTARERVNLRYYRGFADKVQITLNGKQLAPPTPPARGNIEVDINKENVAGILESGQIASGTGAATSAPTATPASTPVATTATPRPPANSNTRPAAAATPRRSPTPIIVGRPAARPSPN